MKDKEHAIDRLFREGFRGEEQFAPEIPESCFDDFFNRHPVPQRRKYSMFRFFSVAASVAVLLTALSWIFFQSFRLQTGSSGLISEKAHAPAFLSRALPSAREGKSAGPEKKSAPGSLSEKGKPARKKSPSVKKSRKKRIGATLFPGIFPAPLFAVDRPSPPPSMEPKNDCLGDSMHPHFAAAQPLQQPAALAQQTEPDASEIESIEFRPSKQEPGISPASASEKTGRKKVLAALFSKSPRLDLSGLPSVDDAKALLITGIGRFIGLSPGQEEMESENNESSEL